MGREDNLNARRTTGRFGEDAAAEFLDGKGLSVIARNWRSGHYEIDIIALGPDGLHFVEVRTRIKPGVLPQDSVNTLKQRKVIEGAKRFLRGYSNGGSDALEVFFDVVGVTVAGEDMVLEYIPQAYIPGL